MNLQVFYQRIRDLEEEIRSPWVVVVSENTPDGGRAGVPSEVSRQTAARLIVEGRARLGTDDEAACYRQELAEVARKAAADRMARQFQRPLFSGAELKTLRDQLRSGGK